MSPARPSQREEHRRGRLLGRLRLCVERALREHSTPGRTALGFALGSFIGVFPSFLIGSPLALFLAGKLRIHRAAAVAGTLLMNPVTAPLCYSVSTMVGVALLGEPLEPAVADGLLDYVRRVGPAFLLGNTVFAAVVSLVTGTVAFVIVRAAVQGRNLGWASRFSTLKPDNPPIMELQSPEHE